MEAVIGSFERRVDEFSRCPKCCGVLIARSCSLFYCERCGKFFRLKKVMAAARSVRLRLGYLAYVD